MYRWKLAAGLALCAGLLAPGAAHAKTSLVEVQSTSHAVLNQLEALGLDVTYEGDERTELMLHGPEDRQILEDSGRRLQGPDGGHGRRQRRPAGSARRRRRSASSRASRRSRRCRPAASRTATWPTINAEIQQIATANPTKVKLLTLNHPTLLGKPVYGLEVSHNVAAAAGKPAFLLTGVHHAREWPTAEFTLEFVHDLLMHDGTDPDATNLLEKGRLIAVPVVNAGRLRPLAQPPERAEAQELPHRAGRDPDARGVHGDARTPTAASTTTATTCRSGAAPGSSTSQTASNSRGEAPGSEPENKNLIELLNANHVTVGDQQPHARPAPAARAELVQRARRGLRPGRLPGACSSASTTTSPGWPSGPWTDVYYEASSTAEQQAFYAYGAFGFTPEATPGFSGNQTFHPPYENVINNYLGIGPRYAGQTMRGLYYDAFKAATEPELHSVISRHGGARRDADADQDVHAGHARNTVWTTGQPAQVRSFPNTVTTKLTVPSNGQVRVAREPVACGRASTPTRASTRPTR